MTLSDVPEKTARYWHEWLHVLPRTLCISAVPPAGASRLYSQARCDALLAEAGLHTEEPQTR